MTRQGLLAALWLITAFVGSFIPAHAQPTHISASLVAESETPAPGAATTIAIRFVPETGWHGYWKNPGDAGFGGEFNWSLPPGVSVSALRYPVPEKLVIQGLMNHVYNGEHALLATLKVDRSVQAGMRLPVRVKADWLACTDKICVPERAELSVGLVAGAGAITDTARASFDSWRARLARPLGSIATWQRDGTNLRIAIPWPSAATIATPWFFAETEDAVKYAAPQQAVRDGERLIVTATAGSGFDGQLHGILATGNGQGLLVEARPGVVPPVAASGSLASGFWVALGGAILGGLLLNILPCVFPVISLKAISLARAGGDEAAVRREALAYAAGVILTCLALGGALLVVRAGGSAVGWAFQLQDPRVVLFLLLLVVAITLNLLGWFHLNSYAGDDRLAARGGPVGAFWTGALAAFVATPCTGPFMAAALGAALVLPVVPALAIFGGLGLGLALPFLAIGYVPALRNRMPRPGPWMVRFQRWMAVPMALTAVALGWLLWRQSGTTGLALGGGAAILLAFLLQRAGFVQKLGASARSWALAAAIIMIAAPLVLPLTRAAAGANTVAGTGDLPFNEARLTELRKANRPVFAYFTADWCLTCKVNEAAAIDRNEVRAAFDRANVAVMVGDWTNGDPAITRFLEAQGRSGVPLYLFYPPGSDAPQVLPQLLTPAMLKGLVR